MYFIVAQAELSQPLESKEVLWQIADVIRVQQKLLETPGVTQDIVGDAGQRAVTFVNVFHLPVTPFKNRNAAEHGTLTILFYSSPSSRVSR